VFRTVMSLVVLVLAVTACGGGETGGDATTAPSTTSVGNTTAPDPGSDTYTPSVPLPADFPVFPGATLWNDFSTGANHNYLYNTPGTAEEIVEFFASSFRDLGLEVTDEIAIFEEFFVNATLPGSDTPVSIYFLDDGLENVTPATPGRGYGVIVDLAAWAAR
jgi:hypothetical protein